MDERKRMANALMGVPFSYDVPFGADRPRFTAGVQERTPHLSELWYFANNPRVAGMAAEDDRITLNPFSPNPPEGQRAVAYNEAARVHMRTNPALRPQYDLTPEQQERFGGYGSPDDIRQTIAARILSGDPSAGQPNPAQVSFRNSLLDHIGPSSPLNEIVERALRAARK